MNEKRKVIRSYATKESREFWRNVEACAREVAQWPDWKKAGVSVNKNYPFPEELDPET